MIQRFRNTIRDIVLPDRSMLLPILRGPFRGARMFLHPRTSLRKVFGVYEHELNGWLEHTLAGVQVIVDVGANDGYFTFGSRAALARNGTDAHVFAYEPHPGMYRELERTLKSTQHVAPKVEVQLFPLAVGAACTEEMTTLQRVYEDHREIFERSRALIKIDVEGAEGEVLREADALLNARHAFLIEIHSEALHTEIQSLLTSRGIATITVTHQSLPLIWTEHRSLDFNCWLLSVEPQPKGL